MTNYQLNRTWDQVVSWMNRLWDSLSVSQAEKNTWNDIVNRLKLDQTVQQATVGAPKFAGIDFNLTGNLPNLEGRLKWNAADGTVDIGLPGGNVSLQIGQEMLVRCKNVSGTMIPNGSVVYISGASGQRPEIRLADPSDCASSWVLGVATEDINTFGYVCIEGLIHDVDTDDMVEGAPIWLSQTPGKFTTTRPTAPLIGVFIGHVVHAHATEGVIIVRPVLIPRMIGLSDTFGEPLLSGQLYQWNQVNLRFELVTPLAGTKVYYVSDESDSPPLRKLTFINGLLISES